MYNNNFSENKVPIVSKNLFTYILVYSFFIISNYLLNITNYIFALNNISVGAVTFVNKTTIFILTTTLMFIIVFSLKKSLSKVYPETKALLYVCLVLVFTKFGINIFKFVFDTLNMIISLDINQIQLINKILSILTNSLNIVLILALVIYVIINKLPKFGLWIGLVIYQVGIIIFNHIIFPIISNEIIQRSINNSGLGNSVINKIYFLNIINLSINLVLTVIKLIILLLIVYKYQNIYVLLDVEETL